MTDVSSFSHIGGRTVSKMHAPEKDENTSWTIFDTCKEGRMKDLVQALENGTDVNVCDEEVSNLFSFFFKKCSSSASYTSFCNIKNAH